MIQTLIQTKEDFVNYLLENEILLEAKLIESIDEEDLLVLSSLIMQNDPGVLNVQIIKSLIEQRLAKKDQTFEKAKPEQVKPHLQESSKEAKYKEETQKIKPELNTNIEIISNYEEHIRERTVPDFVTYFNHRFKAISKILNSRNLISPTSINKLTNKRQKEQITIIGMINDISKTKNEHYILELEDPTGTIKVLVNKNRKDLISIAKDLVYDEVLAITGTFGGDTIFSEKIIIPDISLNKEFRKSPDESYVVFLSDLHFGSVGFMHPNFDRFLKWVNGGIGTDKQKSIAAKIGYIIIAGDLVHGAGVYPSQEQELEIKDICEQYDKVADLIKKIPSHIRIIMAPGNHDAMRIADPQPTLSKEYAKSLWEMENVTMVTSPSMINVHKSKNFPGFDILIYHGFSMPYYADKVDSVREAGGMNKPDRILRYFLQKRHLSPSQTSSLYIPDIRLDPMVIDKVPDFLFCGHAHIASASNYRNITLVTGSCWDGVNEYALKFGTHPMPAKVPIVNLQTREIRIMNFN